MNSVRYTAVTRIEEGLAPTGRLERLEVDEWVLPPMSYQLVALLLPHEDFAYASEEHQRCFLLLGAEALYGPNCDPEFLAEIDEEANAVI